MKCFQLLLCYLFIRGTLGSQRVLCYLVCSFNLKHFALFIYFLTLIELTMFEKFTS